jgi:hypothetical protein
MSKRTAQFVPFMPAVKLFSITALYMAMTVGLMLLPLQAQAQSAREYDLKAAFIYNFALFTEWPAGTPFEKGNLNICINPASEMREHLHGLAGREARGKKIALQYFSTLESLHSCHIVFMDSGDRKRYRQIGNALSNSSVLTIADEGGEAGTIISLTLNGNRVVFDIDMQAAHRARLIISSKLLRLARTVR